MSSTATTRLRLEQQALGENSNTWGDDRLNQVLRGIDDAVAGVASITVAGSDVTLTSLNYAADQARMAVIRLDGTPGATRNIIIPSVQKTYQVHNRTSYAQTVKTSSGVSVLVPPSRITFVYCDGLDCYSTDIAADLTDYVTVANTSGNRLINGGFAITSRPVGLGLDAAYILCDRWYALGNAATALDPYTSAPEQGSEASLAIDRTSAGLFGVAQIVESNNCIDCRSSSVTFSGRMRNRNTFATGNTTWRYAILSWAGTADVVTRDVVNNWASTNYTPGNFFIAGVSVVAQGSLVLSSAGTWTGFATSGTVPSGCNNLIVMIWTSDAAAGQCGADLGRFQLEKGGVATGFAKRPYGTELALCQRYYHSWRSSTRALISSGLAFSANQAAFPLNFPVPMRAPPTLTYSNVAPTNGSGGQGISSAVVLSDFELSARSVGIFTTNTGAFTVGQASLLYVGTSAGGFIALDAEL